MYIYSLFEIHKICIEDSKIKGLHWNPYVTDAFLAEE